MDIMDLLKVGATLIQNNNDSSTTGLDSNLITGALGSLLGGGSTGGGMDLGSILGSLTGAGGNSVAGESNSGGISDIVASWVGSGENQPIEPSQVGEMVSEEKIAHFAQELGISEESARQALADALPEVVNQATPEGNTDMLSGLLEQVGGISGAMELAGKFMR